MNAKKKGFDDNKSIAKKTKNIFLASIFYVISFVVQSSMVLFAE
jgi:hypothetical protein